MSRGSLKVAAPKEGLHDILVVGERPGGLTAAILLRPISPRLLVLEDCQPGQPEQAQWFTYILRMLTGVGF